MVFRSAFVWGACLALSACGGGGGSSGNNPPPSPPAVPPTVPPADPFGLTQRAALASFNLPLAGTTLSAFNLVNAFPNLNFNAGLFAAGVPDETRMVVVEQGGQIIAFADDAGATTTRIVLDITGRVVTAGEQGLLGLAFDPQFTQNRFIYLHYSEAADASGPRRSVISRMTWNAATDLIDTGTEKILLEIEQPFTNHNGGMLAFGPDGYLYIAMGDGGSGGDPDNNAQNQTSLLGKMLRIDVNPQNPNNPYDIPLDNPFVGDPNVRPEIYANGFRNPFRFSFDRQTGVLWLGDVGQNTLEEIDIIESGGNYGWRVLEGTQNFDGSANTLPMSAFTPPVFEYGPSEGVAIIGGYIYRGSQLASLFGRYLYSDFGSGTIWALSWDGNQVTSNDVIGNISNPTSFAETNNGEVLVVSRFTGLFRFEAAAGGGNQIPTLLSDTGLFPDLSTLTPASGLIEYVPSQPFWSDGADKRRWVGIPDGRVVDFTADDWTLPVGSVAVKHFEINLIENDPTSATRLETRVLLNTTSGWQGFTYRWDASQTDATLLAGRETETLTISTPGGSRDQLYEYPSRTDCLLCHSTVEGFTLSLKTPQMNTDFNYAGVIDNQIRSWNNINLFNTNTGDPAQYTSFPALIDDNASIEDRARSYLDVNCSQCHQPGGSTPTNLDLRAATNTLAMNALGMAPQAGDLGIANAEIIAVGVKERSVLWQRMQRLNSDRMPPLASHLVDADAVDVVGRWIDSI